MTEKTKEDILQKYNGEYMDRDDILNAMQEYMEQETSHLAEALVQKNKELKEKDKRIKDLKEWVNVNYPQFNLAELEYQIEKLLAKK